MPETEVLSREQAGMSGDAERAHEDDASPAKAGPMVAFRELAAGERRPIFWLFVMLCMEFAAFAILIPVLPFFLMHSLHLGPAEVGTLLSCFSLAQLIGAAACGRLSDSVGRYPVIIAAFAWAGLGFGAMSLVTNFMEALVVRVAQGLSGGTAALCDAYVLDLVPGESRPSYIGLAGGVKGISFVVGPGIGGLLIFLQTPRRVIFVISGALALMSAVMGAFVIEESLPKSKRRPLCGKRSEADEGSAAADREAVNGGLLCIWFCRFWSAMGLGFLFATYAFLIKDNFGWSDAQFGMVLFCSGILSATVQGAIFPRVVVWTGVRVVMLSGSVLGMVAFIMLPQAHRGVHVCALAFFSLSGACIEASIPVLIGFYVSERHLGAANGVTASWRSFATVLTPLIAGSLYKVDAKLAYYTAAGCYVLSVVGAAGLFCLRPPAEEEADALLAKGK